MLSQRFLLALLSLLSLFLAGCGDSKDYVVTSSPDQVATIALRSVLAQSTVPPSVASFRATGFDQEQNILYGPATTAKATQVTWPAVPVQVTEWGIEYLAVDGRLVGTARVQVQLVAGQTYLVDSPEITLITGVLQSLTVSPSTRTIAKGTDTLFTATGAFSDGTTRNLTSTASWTSGSPSVASVDQGRATGLTVGTSTVTASFGNISATATVIVSDAELLRLRLSPVRSSIARGTSQSFTAEGFFTDGSFQDVTSQASWTSSNTTVSTVVEGDAQGLEPGTADITATLGNVTESAQLTVTPAALESLTVSGPSSIAKGTSADFSATGRFSDNSTQDLTTQVEWSVDPADAATFDGGRLTSVLNGTVTVTATLGEVSDDAPLEITAATITSLQVRTAVDGAEPLAYVNQTVSLQAVATYTDTTTQDVTGDAVWTTDDPTVATVDAGLVTGTGLGRTNVTATLGASSSLQIDVESQWPELSLEAGQSYSFNTTSGALIPAVDGQTVPPGWNPDTHRLKVRSFTVASGTLLEVTGDYAFSVYADGDVDIAGVIDAAGADGARGVDGRRATDGSDGEDGGWVEFYHVGQVSRTGSVRAHGGHGGNGGNFDLPSDNDEDASAGNGGDGGRPGLVSFFSVPNGSANQTTGFSGRGGAGGDISIQGSNSLAGGNVTITAGAGGRGSEYGAGGNGGSIWLAWENRAVAIAGDGGAGGSRAAGGRGGNVTIGSYNRADKSSSIARAVAGNGGRGGDGGPYDNGGAGGAGGEVSIGAANIAQLDGQALAFAGNGGPGGKGATGGVGGQLVIEGDNSSADQGSALARGGTGGSGASGGPGGRATVKGSQTKEALSTVAVYGGVGGSGTVGPGGPGGIAEVLGAIIEGIVENGVDGSS